MIVTLPKYWAASQDGARQLRVKHSLIYAFVAIQLGSPALAQTIPGSTPSDPPRYRTQNCVPGTSPEERRRCDQAVSDQLKASSQTTVLDGGWRLVKTKVPGSTSETVSAMHTVDAVKS